MITKKSRIIFCKHYSISYDLSLKYFLTFVLSFGIIYTMKKIPWTQAERNLLKDYYYTISRRELHKILPGRTINAMVKQVGYLKKRGWYFKEEI